MTGDEAHDIEFHGHMNWALWRKVLLFGRPYRPYFIALAFVAMCTAACEVGVLMLPGLLIDRVALYPKNPNLGPYFLIYGLVIIVFVICITTFILLAGWIATRVQYDMRAAAFRRLQELSFSYFDQRPIGWIMARLTSDCSNLSRIMGWALLDIVWSCCMMAGVIGAMLYLNWRLALWVLLIAPPLLWASRYFQIHLLITSRKVRKANSHVTASFNEGITGVRTTKSLVRETQNLHEFQSISSEMYTHSVSNALYAAVFLPVVMTLCGMGVAIALGLGGNQVLQGGLTVGTLVIFCNCVAQLSNPIQDMARTLTMIQGAQASAERIQGLLDTVPQVRDIPELLTPQLQASDRINSIEFRDVCFGYATGKPIIEHLNLTLRGGQTYALVGSTGGGKSTLASLLCRFYEPTAGRILINGRDYRQYTLHWLQSKLGIVLQTPILFSGTVRDNIRYGNLAATDAQVEQAAQRVNAHSFIMNLAQGYDTQIGEGGMRLSTGQKQLLSMARAILADPQILIMDEATSSVDTETEGLIQSAVEHILKGRIAVVIAHRLSTIRRADQILVIERGIIEECGTHDELLKNQGKYYSLYTHQFAEEHTSQVLAKSTAKE